MPYINDFDVYYTNQEAQQPPNAIPEFNGASNDINKGFGGEFVYLIPSYTDDASKAATSFKIVIQGTTDPLRKDMAKGAGGDYRYVIPVQGPQAKVTEAQLIRSESALQHPPSGYSGITSDINKGRQGDFLYIIWKTA
ncbi:hypothetical protein VNI00_012888 [Paramarasmius palmivorus]|uniref:Uncharacterized protein n=1 Tax=Paramarasmius palmivorus TaxID=297713 RepID=A0AAW0C3Q2_9AGAR